MADSLVDRCSRRGVVGRAASAILVAAAITACGGSEPTPIAPATTPSPAPPAAAAQSASTAEAVRGLGAASTAPGALDLVAQRFESAMSVDDGDVHGATVKPLIDAVVVAVNDACVAGRLEGAVKSKALKLLADAADPRGEPCAVRVIEQYGSSDGAPDLAMAARAAKVLKSGRVAAPLYAAFERLKASDPRAQLAYRDVYEAMVALRDPSWRAGLLAHLAHPVDPHDPKNALDEQFWQLTSADVLGRMKATEAVRPLLKILLSPAKGFLGTTAVLALVKIGKPAMPPALALLRGEDKELASFARDQALAEAVPGAHRATKEEVDGTSIAIAAVVLGTLGRGEATTPLLDVLARTPNPFVRAAIARELPKLPRTPASVAAFQRAFEQTPIKFSLPPGVGARESLIDVGAMFFDASLVPWFVEKAKALRGDDVDTEPLREATLATVLKLMSVEQIPKVGELAMLKSTGTAGTVSTVGAGFAPEIALGKELASRCERRVDCYVRALGEPRSQEQATQFVGIKAAYMAGVLGDASTPDAIVAELPHVTSPAVRYVAVSALDALRPRGDVALADRLQRIIDEAEASKNSARIAANAPLKSVIYRLRARAEE